MKILKLGQKGDFLYFMCPDCSTIWMLPKEECRPVTFILRNGREKQKYASRCPVCCGNHAAFISKQEAYELLKV